jgi:transcriptional regulator with XRE-family HTH domain
MRRRLLGISQADLAKGLSLTFQQVQKYERGANRISASKLYAIGRQLDVPVAWFFDGLDEAGQPADDVAQALAAMPELRHVAGFDSHRRAALSNIITAMVATVAGSPTP